MKEYNNKNKKYNHMIKSIFKAQDMLDKYNKIYESIKKGKFKKKSSESSATKKNNEPISHSVDFEYGFLPELSAKKGGRNSSMIDDGSTRRTTKRSSSVEDGFCVSDRIQKMGFLLVEVAILIVFVGLKGLT